MRLDRILLIVLFAGIIPLAFINIFLFSVGICCYIVIFLVFLFLEPRIYLKRIKPKLERIEESVKNNDYTELFEVGNKLFKSNSTSRFAVGGFLLMRGYLLEDSINDCQNVLNKMKHQMYRFYTTYYNVLVHLDLGDIINAEKYQLKLSKFANKNYSDQKEITAKLVAVAKGITVDPSFLEKSKYPIVKRVYDKYSNNVK